MQKQVTVAVMRADTHSAAVVATPTWVAAVPVEAVAAWRFEPVAVAPDLTAAEQVAAAAVAALAELLAELRGLVSAEFAVQVLAGSSWESLRGCEVSH